ncbi:MAG TPA: Sec-independent protein translocase subunit TatA [Candidatus Acidoferrum sp.]|nr:Sec-independent protein translocase subunit TatA [Candidatus Acidoferrum sp.]
MLGGLHIWHLLILAFVVVVVFGTKNLKNFGEDLGGAIHGFKKAMNEGKEAAQKEEQDKLTSGTNAGHTVDVKPDKVDSNK